MTIAPHSIATATDILYREAAALDEQAWDDWLALFHPDCTFWVPTWLGEHEPASDPAKQLSHMYYKTRGGLEDRVWRVRSGRSPASSPLPRTTHMVGNILVTEASADTIAVKSHWTVHTFSFRAMDTKVMHGRSVYRLERRGDAGQAGWAIASKIVYVHNDYVATMLDFYNI
jgi:anthranilate 1,2-dioxygenase (deaminating, decarboxylating) small subunit